MTTIRYHIDLTDDRGGFASQALAADYGTVASTVGRYDGTHDLALIDIPAEHAGHFEEMLEADENVTGYRTSSRD